MKQPVYIANKLIEDNNVKIVTLSAKATQRKENKQ